MGGKRSLSVERNWQAFDNGEKVLVTGRILVGITTKVREKMLVGFGTNPADIDTACVGDERDSFRAFVECKVPCALVSERHCRPTIWFKPLPYLVKSLRGEREGAAFAVGARLT